MDKMRTAFIGFIVSLVAALLNAAAFLGMSYAIAMFTIWQTIGVIAVAVLAVGILVVALSLDSLRRYFGNLFILRATMLVGIIGAAASMFFFYLLLTTDLITVELGTNALITASSLVSSSLIGVFLVLLSLILFVSRYQIGEMTRGHRISNIALASAMMNAIAGLIIISEIVLPSNISIFISIPALILNALLFYRLSYFE